MRATPPKAVWVVLNADGDPWWVAATAKEARETAKDKLGDERCTVVRYELPRSTPATCRKQS